MGAAAHGSVQVIFCSYPCRHSNSHRLLCYPRNADRLPKTVLHLIAETNTDVLLDPTILRPTVSEFDYLHMLDGTRYDPLSFNSAAFYPHFILNSASVASLASARRSPSSSSYSSSLSTALSYRIDYSETKSFTPSDNHRLHVVSRLAETFPQPCLISLWKNLEYGPNVVTTEILAERRSGMNKMHEMECVVPKERLRSYCQLLLEFLGR